MAKGDIPYNRAEMMVKSSEDWTNYLNAMVNARTSANHAKIDMEVLRMRMQEWISADANNRMRTKL